MTVAELIQKLQSLDVDPNAPINFFVNDFNNADVETIKVMEYTPVIPPDGSWKVSKKSAIEFYLHSEELEG